MMIVRVILKGTPGLAGVDVASGRTVVFNPEYYNACDCDDSGGGDQ